MPIKFQNNTGVSSPNFDLAKAIMEARFPDVVARNNFTVDADFLREGLSGRTVIGGPDNNKITVNPWERPNNTTPNVIDLVATILHEITHAENNTPEARKTDYASTYSTNQGGRELSPGRIGSLDYAKSSGLKDVENKTLDKAVKLNFASQDKNNKSVGELNAEMQAITLMNSRGISTEMDDKVSEIMKDPAVANWVARNKYPQTPTLKSFDPDVTDQIGSFIKSLFN